MIYAFGLKVGVSLSEAYKAHQNVCPYCKNENTWSEERGKASCSCGASFKPNTKNLKYFEAFLSRNERL